MKRLRPFIIPLLLSSTLAPRSESRAEPPDVKIPRELIIERFEIARNGDPIVLPAKINGIDYQLQIETRLRNSVFSNSSLGDPINAARPFWNDREQNIEFRNYTSPHMTLGTMTHVWAAPVIGIDFAKYRHILPDKTDGALGLDFLTKYIISIDYDEGELLFLKSIPEEFQQAAASIPIIWDVNRMDLSPEVSIELGVERQHALFRIDLANNELGCGQMTTIDLMPLVEKGEFFEISRRPSKDHQNLSNPYVFRGNVVRIGKYEVSRPIFFVGGNRKENPKNLLGRNFWSRFRLILDFAHLRLYLLEGKQFARLDRFNATGLALEKLDGKVKAESIEIESPAEKAGLKVGDVFVRVGDLKADQTDLRRLRERLSQGGEIPCEILRGQQALSIVISTTASNDPSLGDEPR